MLGVSVIRRLAALVTTKAIYFGVVDTLNVSAVQVILYAASRPSPILFFFEEGDVLSVLCTPLVLIFLWEINSV